jgi:hypothetical protein
MVIEKPKIYYVEKLINSPPNIIYTNQPKDCFDKINKYTFEQLVNKVIYDKLEGNNIEELIELLNRLNESLKPHTDENAKERIKLSNKIIERLNEIKNDGEINTEELLSEILIQ